VRQYVVQLIKLRRDYITNNNNLKPAVQAQFLPEYALPYLLHHLAHHPNFESDKTKNYEYTYR
jgi:hypothetical protein